MTTAEIITTQQVVITETAAQMLEVQVTTAPAVVQVTTEGPQGPRALTPELRVDTATASTVYVGRAANGSSEAASVWTITRSTYSPAGVRTSKGTATAVTWTGRAGHTYV